MASNQLATVSDLIYSARTSFEAVSADRSVSFEREAEFAIQVLGNNDYALKVALGNRQSVVDAVTNVAAIGVSLNPAKKQAYLVPRKNRICLDISYMGLIDLAISSGSIKWAQAAVVYDADTFALNGLDRPPTHVFDPFDKDRGEPIGVYVVVKTRDGDEYLTETMSIAEVYAIRDRSESWKKGEAGKRGPWETDPAEMMKKTVVKRAYKYWPKSPRLDEAIHFLNTEGGEGLPQLQQRPECPPELLHGLLAKVKKAPTEAALTELWKRGLAEIKPTGDMRAYEEFKAAVAERGSKFQRPPDDGQTIDMPPPNQPPNQPGDYAPLPREPGGDDE